MGNRLSPANRRWSVGVRSMLAALVVAAGLVVAGVPVAAQQGSDPAPSAEAMQIEMDFLMGMIPHHRGAVMMSEMALQKAARPEVRELAQRVIDSQTAEVALMSNWLRDWYGMEAPAGTMMPQEMMAMMDMPMLRGQMPSTEQQQAQMRALEMKSGAEFDIAYLSMLAEHHAMAIMMTPPVLLGGHHAALYDQAAMIAQDQGEEIGEIQMLLQQFYGIDRPQ
jgi:uncharacterized protein (DUF305 family)